MAIKDVKVWSRTDRGMLDSRIYVHTEDGREGCKYLTGNRWQKKGTIDGNLTDEDWAEAQKLALWDNKWHTMYANGDQNWQRQDYERRAPRRCPDCGEIEGPRSGCGGGNCGANHPARY